MEVKNNYKECITNFACSIRKYFELDYKHNTLEYIDRILEDKRPENVIVILLDGMGSNILDRALDKDSFFRRNKLKDITTVFPATTTAATVSMMTGLNPVEHGWLGWNAYIKPIDKVITMFLNAEKGTYKDELIECPEFLTIKNNELKYITTVQEINEKNKYKAYDVVSFGDKPYKDFDDMLSIIKDKTKEDGRKYIYAYNSEPDSIMHKLGTDTREAIKLIKERNDKIEKLTNELNNSIIFVVADHGHMMSERLYLEDYPKLYNLLERNTSGETRSCILKVKDGMKDVFVEEFKKCFGNDFELYSTEEVISSNLYGDGIPNPLFKDALGDFIAISRDVNKCLLNVGDDALMSNHGGYSDDEVYIPLIVIQKQ